MECHQKRGDEVRVLSRRDNNTNDGVIFFKGDLLDTSINFFNFLNNVDILYHCAGELHDESIMYSLHVEGTKRLLNLAIGKVGRWVQLSSVGAYGAFNGIKINEKTLEMPVGTYESTKTKADDLVRKIATKERLNYVILRPSIVFGELMPNTSLKQMLFLIKKSLFFYPNRNANVNYVHVEDVINALTLCGERRVAIGNVYILSDSVPLKKMVDSFSEGLKVKSPSLYLPAFIVYLIVNIFGGIPKFPLSKKRLEFLTNSCTYDAYKIQKELGFTFKEDLAERFKNYAQKHAE